MAKKNGGTGGDDILLNINVTGREDLTGARNDAKALKNEMKDGAKQDVSAGVKTLRQQIREATVEAQKLAETNGENSKAFRDAAKRVAELKDRQGDLNKTFEAFDPDNKFKVFSATAAGGAKIVQGYAGAMAFLGVNSETAAETIAKLQGIMAFTDAIGSLEDIKDSFKNLSILIGLNSTSAKENAVSQTEAAAEVIGSNEAVAVSEQELVALRQTAAAASIAAEQAVAIAKAEGLDATIAMTAAEEVALEALAAQQVAVGNLTAAEAALAEATLASTLATEEQGAAMVGTTVAEEGATAGAYGFGTALKLIGIGLIISALAYLITNFSKIKGAVTDMFPALKDAGGVFNKFKEIVYGVGNVILQFVIAPIKAIIDVVRGDFKAAMQDIKDGFNVVKSFNEGVAYEAKNIAEEQRKVRVSKEIEANERIIAERKALGQETLKLEVANNKLRISLIDKDDEDYSKKKADLESANTIAINAEYKKRHDKYLELLKQDLDAIKANAKENEKIVKANSNSEREVALSELDIKYSAELALLNKRKSANKNYNKDYANLVEARNIEEQRVNKKYNDLIQAYNDETNQTYFTSFEKKTIEISKKAEELLKNATPQQAAQIKQNEAFLLGKNTDEANANSTSIAAATDLVKTEDKDRPNPRDSAVEATRKTNEIAAAKLAAENAAYELKKLQLIGQYDELAKLDADHEKSKNDIEKEGADARKQIAELETQNRLRLFDAVAQGASVASDILGDSTIAGKALAVASATIATYSAIAGQLAAFSGIPIPGYAIAQAITTGLVGLAQVKKILSVQVPAKSGGGGGAGGASAPVINTTVLQQSQNGTAQVTSAINQKNNQANKPLKAYIVNKDLQDQNDQNAYYEQQSTY